VCMDRPTALFRIKRRGVNRCSQMLGGEGATQAVSARWATDRAGNRGTQFLAGAQRGLKRYAPSPLPPCAAFRIAESLGSASPESNLPPSSSSSIASRERPLTSHRGASLRKRLKGTRVRGSTLKGTKCPVARKHGAF
jgi:hypothetical protein